MPLSSPPDISLAWDVLTFTGSGSLTITDAFKYLISQDGTPQSVTIPPNSTVAFIKGTQISFKQGGAGLLSFIAGAGVTIQSRGGVLTANGQFAVMSIVQDSIDVWSLFGDLA